MLTSWKRLFILLIVYSLSKHVISNRRNFNFPFRDPLRNNETPIKKTKSYDQNRICSRCNEMFLLSESELKIKNSKKRFCIRLFQVQRCIRKLKNDHPKCHNIGLMALNTGVYLKIRNYGCKKMNVNANDIVNIFKELRKPKVSQAEKCKFKYENKNLTYPRHCGIFGDPHIKTFSDVRQTCVVEGAWALLDNDYVVVQVSNEILQTTQSTSATATTKISVIFKEFDPNCVSQKIYEATSEYLPNVFKDGSYYTGPKGCRTEVLKESSDEITINSCSLATRILIRRVGKYLTFNINTPFAIANQSTGLCSDGCPANELVDYETYFEENLSRRYHENSINDVSNTNVDSEIKHYNTPYLAIKTCENSNLTDFYFDSCVFDLLTTGDAQFSHAASLAMIDATSFDPKIRLRRENSVLLSRNSLFYKSKRNDYSTARTLNSSSFILLILCFFIYIIADVR